MAVGEGREERCGVAPAVVHWLRLVSESARSSVDLQLERGRLVESLYSGSWTFAENLELGPTAVLGTELGTVLGTSDLVLLLLST